MATLTERLTPVTFLRVPRSEGMNFTKTLPLIAAAAALALPAAASADTLVTPAPGAQNLASGGGYLAWSAPAPDGGFQLTVRAPDGTVSVPDVATSQTPLDPAIGSGGFAAQNRKLLVLYARGGDIHQYDLRATTESKVPGASSAAYKEASPGISYGRVTFVRTGGANNGIFFRDKGRARKVSSSRPSELAFNGSRVAYPHGDKVIVRRVSGQGRPSTIRAEGKPSGLVLTRYSVTFLTEGGRAWQSPRFGGSSRVDRVDTAREASEQLPASTNSIANGRTFVSYYADDEGVKRLSTQNIFRP